MKTIDVRLTLTPVALCAALAQLRKGAAPIYHEIADAMEMCARYQRIVREAYEAGVPLQPRLVAVASAGKLLPLPGEGDS